MYTLRRVCGSLASKIPVYDSALETSIDNRFMAGGRNPTHFQLRTGPV
jgi:hypothetical protein